MPEEKSGLVPYPVMTPEGKGGLIPYPVMTPTGENVIPSPLVLPQTGENLLSNPLIPPQTGENLLTNPLIPPQAIPNRGIGRTFNPNIYMQKGGCEGDSKKGSKGGSDSGHMAGENGTQTSSKTTWKNGKTERINVENPSPGERPGQVHYHDSSNKTWYYDIEKNVFYDPKTDNLAPKSIQKLLNDKNFAKGIRKALDILGE